MAQRFNHRYCCCCCRCCCSPLDKNGDMTGSLNNIYIYIYIYIFFFLYIDSWILLKPSIQNHSIRTHTHTHTQPPLNRRVGYEKKPKEACLLQETPYEGKAELRPLVRLSFCFGGLASCLCSGQVQRLLVSERICFWFVRSRRLLVLVTIGIFGIFHKTELA